MLMYMFNPDHAGGVVHDALLAAARRGVEVNLLIDSFGSDAPPKFFADLAEAGVRDPSPPRWWTAVFGTHPTLAERAGMADASGRFRGGP
jgi:hypothetical protein